MIFRELQSSNYSLLVILNLLTEDDIIVTQLLSMDVCSCDYFGCIVLSWKFVYSNNIYLASIYVVEALCSYESIVTVVGIPITLA